MRLVPVAVLILLCAPLAHGGSPVQRADAAGDEWFGFSGLYAPIPIGEMDCHDPGLDVIGWTAQLNATHLDASVSVLDIGTGPYCTAAHAPLLDETYRTVFLTGTFDDPQRMRLDDPELYVMWDLLTGQCRAHVWVPTVNDADVAVSTCEWGSSSVRITLPLAGPLGSRTYDLVDLPFQAHGWSRGSFRVVPANDPLELTPTGSIADSSPAALVTP